MGETVDVLVTGTHPCLLSVMKLIVTQEATTVPENAEEGFPRLYAPYETIYTRERSQGCGFR